MPFLALLSGAPNFQPMFLEETISIERNRGGLSSMWLIKILVGRKLLVSQQCALAAMKSGNMWMHINRTVVRSKEEIIPLFLGLLIKGKLQTGAHSMKNHQDSWETDVFALWGESERIGLFHPGEEWKTNSDQSTPIEGVSKEIQPGSSLKYMVGKWKARAMNWKVKI